MERTGVHCVSTENLGLKTANSIGTYMYGFRIIKLNRECRGIWGWMGIDALLASIPCKFSYIKGIRQRRTCFYPVLETCYDAAEHEKMLRESEVDRNTNYAVVKISTIATSIFNPILHELLRIVLSRGRGRGRKCLRPFSLKQLFKLLQSNLVH